MKYLWIEKNFKYDGTQLKSLFAYLGYNVLGDSVVSWVGPCDVNFEHMVDGEDLLAQSEIRGSEMLHFIFEFFDQTLITGVFVQRLFASMVKDVIEEKLSAPTNSGQKPQVSLQRRGDDLYWNGKKLSISIACRSPNSVMVHFAINVKNAGTPVSTCALEDWELSAPELAEVLMARFVDEIHSIQQATWKVKSVL